MLTMTALYMHAFWRQRLGFVASQEGMKLILDRE